MKNLFYIFSIAFAFSSCNSQPNKTNAENSIEKTETKQQELPPYSVNLAQVEFTQPLEDLRFYDQILEVRNNRVKTLKFNNCIPKNILILIDQNDSITYREQIRRDIVNQNPYYGLDLETIEFHYLVKNSSNQEIGILSETCRSFYLRGCGHIPRNPNRLTLTNDSIFEISNYSYSTKDVDRIIDSIQNSKRNVLNPDSTFKQYILEYGPDLFSTKDTSRLIFLNSAIKYLNELTPIHSNAFQIELTFLYCKKRSYNPEKCSKRQFKKTIQFLSYIRKLERKNLANFDKHIKKFELENGKLSISERKYLQKRISIRVMLMPLPPPPPPPPPPPIAVQEVPWKTETGWVEEVPYIEEFEALEDPNL